MIPIVLDFDRSVGPLAGELRLALGDWQEDVRFACSSARLDRLREVVEARLPVAHGTVLTGSGDFHHVSVPLIERQVAAASAPLRIVVFDNHPDNMRFPFGVHCGSWVRRIAMAAGVAGVDVVGITSGDIGWAHGWENRLAPLRAGRLRYWSVGVDTGWSRWLGVSHAFRGFDDAGTMIAALCESLHREPMPTYVSIDKDVFSTEVVHTNWDQGCLLEAQVHRAIGALHGRIVGSDITGDVSAYRYRTPWKRWLSRIDAQDTEIPASQLVAWQVDQHALNQRLVARLDAAAAARSASP